MNTCTCCFEDYLVKCNSEIVVNAQLVPNSTYTWVITDKFNRQYSGDITTDGNGFIPAIPITDLPAGLLTEFSGDFTMQFFVSGNNCNPAYFKIAQVTNCIGFTIQAGTREKNNLGCSLD